MQNLYVEPNILKQFAVGEEADGADVWQILAEAASRLFDRATNVSDGFFCKTSGELSEKTFQMNGTPYLKVYPYLQGSIESVKQARIGGDEILTTAFYYERDGYLIFYSSPSAIDPTLYNLRSQIKVHAKFGFSDVPADIKQAVIEQALWLWRKRDSAFTELSGVSSSVVQPEMSSTFKLVTDKYRELYSSVAIG